eukprot:2799641-Rhodomonas_salina.1
MDQGVAHPYPNLLCEDGTDPERQVCAVALVSVLHASAQPHVRVPCAEDHHHRMPPETTGGIVELWLHHRGCPSPNPLGFSERL